LTKRPTTMQRTVAAAAVSVLMLAAGGAARADATKDWMQHKIPEAEPNITYDGEPIVWKFAHPVPPASVVPPVWQGALKWFTEATDGKFVIEEFGAGTLLGTKDGFKGVRSKIAEYATCYVAQEGRGFDLSKVWQQPFVAPSNMAVLSRVTAELAPKYFKPEFEQQEVYFAYQAITSAYDLMSKKPVRRLEDFKGLKIGIPSGDPEVGAALGAVFVQIPFPDLYVSMQQGMIDAIAWTNSAFIAYKIPELAKYHTTLNLTVATIDACVNRAAFDALPPDMQDAFLHFQQLVSPALTQVVGINAVNEAKAAYAAAGVETIVMEPAEMDRVRKAVEPLVEKWAAEQEAAGRPARALLADIRRLEEKYAGMSDDELFMLAVTDPVPGFIGD